MRSSGRGTSERAATAVALNSRESRPVKVIRESTTECNPDTFDVRSFLNRALVPKKLVEFRKNEVVFAAGDPAANVLFIEKGVVRLSVISDNGKTAVVTVLDTGNFLGIWCLAGQARRTSTATAMAPTIARVIPKEQMIRLLRTDPAFSEYFICYLLKRNMQIGQHVIDLLFDPSEKRLIRALLFLAQFGAKSGDDATLSRVPQELLAEMIGSTRTHVNGFMSKLKRLGFVEYNQGMMRIHRTPLMSLL